MEQELKYRTDLALESKQLYDRERGKDGEIQGVVLDKVFYGEDIQVVRIEILDERGEKVLGKSKGNYITIEVDGLFNNYVKESDLEELKKRTSLALASELKTLIKFHYYLKVLVIGLGNDKVTPDSLGPYTVSKVKVTRHLFIMYEANGDDEMACVSGFIPGVTGSTGMETAELVKKAADVCDPEVIIVIDSLAAREIQRISTTIQINDTGISPGAGMGNMRSELSEKTMGRKVIAIGVPTVIDSRTLIMDTLQDCLQDPAEIDAYIKEKGQDMIVTSTDIDQVIKEFSDIIANGINIILHPGIYS